MRFWKTSKRPIAYIFSKCRYIFSKCRGISTKFNLLRKEVDTCSYDIIVLVETWLSSNIQFSETCLGGYKIFRLDQSEQNSNKKRGRSVLIAIKDKLQTINY